MAIAQLDKQIEQNVIVEARKNLAFLVPKIARRDDILGLQREICDSAELAHSIGHQAIKSISKSNFTETLERLAATIRQEAGTLWVALPKRLVKYTRADLLLDDYGQEIHDPKTDGHELLAIPRHSITAVHGMPLPTADVVYEPSLDLRIQTSHDTELINYVGAGELRAVSNPGRWHRFPLGDIAITFAST